MDTKMNKPPILIDQDGVLADFVSGMYEGLQKILHPDDYQSLPPPNTHYNFYIEDNLPEQHKNLTEEIMNQNHFFFNLKPFPGIRTWMNILKERANVLGHDVFICTKPAVENRTCCSDKVNWINWHLGPEWAKKVILAPDKTIVHGAVLVDDHPEVKGLMTPSWTQIVMDQSYNRHLTLKRVHGWNRNTVQTILEDLSN